MDNLTATISITNLRLRTYIGFQPEEKDKRQDVVINAKVKYSLAPSIMLNDDVDHALDYKTITKNIIHHTENGRFLLLEKLVSDVLAICLEPKQATWAEVTVDKPHALRFADSVSLTLESQK